MLQRVSLTISLHNLLDFVKSRYTDASVKIHWQFDVRSPPFVEFRPAEWAMRMEFGLLIAAAVVEHGIHLDFAVHLAAHLHRTVLAPCRDHYSAQLSLLWLAFSDVYDAFIDRHQGSQADGTQAAFRRMHVEPEPICDDEIVRLRREMERTKYDTDGEASETLTEPDTDTEKQLQKLGKVWVGCYLLGLGSYPVGPERGWTAGKGPLENVPIGLLLCTRSFAKSYNINLRNPHARFNFFPDSKGLYIMGCSRSPSAQLTVNGEAATRRPYHLNQHSMKILCDKLEYNFQWTEFAAKHDFKEARKRYMARTFGELAAANMDIEMPTPLPNNRTIGRWTLGEALGKGGQGRVFFASDRSANMAAIKVVERTSRNYHNVDKEIETIREVTNFAQKSDDEERILRMVEVIYPNGEKFSSKTAFDNVVIVLKPITSGTFADLVRTQSKGGCKGMTTEAAAAFRAALLGVKVMHDGGWLHSDLKPTNIGLIGNPFRPVLLDIGTSKHIQAGGSLVPEPGTSGTIGYLAPELELKDYDHSIDIWSMGIILFELTYGCHPWKFSINPWRDGEDNEKLRPSFWKSYQNAIDKMAKDYKNARASPARGYIHLGDLFIEMVRCQWAANNHAQRPDIDEVLQHPAWGPLLPKSPQAKRRRLDDGLEDGKDRLDIVATQGAYLVPRAGTPVWPEDNDGEFAVLLECHLKAVLIEQGCRRAMYHEAADEFAMGHTPPEVKEKRKAELKAMEEFEDLTSDDGSDNDDDGKGGNYIDVMVPPRKPVAAPDWFPTPPLSAERPLVTPHNRKRRRISREDKEEKERPAKKHANPVQEAPAAAEDTVPNTAQQKGRKRRRTLNVGDEERDKKRPNYGHAQDDQLVDDAMFVTIRQLG
ncbi:hypothetical protein GQX73_g4381 [Xylaria multiplex]|uniref:Protein kinase domain-containing protein n=1 Tax=Xylaria multiplex TaxID=323545 RepID=A0A7C8IY75_9PEZI|nr:hypothetical protein GQX73_g4381 [Xylaria multiplex]